MKKLITLFVSCCFALSFSEIAGIFGKTESWARVTYYRAKNKIREEIKND